MKVVHWFVGSWLSRIYLALVAAATVFASVPSLARYAEDGSGYSHPDILPTALSLPGSILLLTLVGRATGGQWLSVEGVQWMWVGCVAGGALINAAAITGVVAVARRLKAKLGSPSSAAAER
ncbi:SCO4225 family membrane protein [Actinoplanes sp. NPDC049118]|uniref:SCO4225 family membrane protein n=1 Tax=Actinoplanes sp. NPDC049118 TaxID=3155769 RepID=UPI0034032439